MHQMMLCACSMAPSLNNKQAYKDPERGGAFGGMWESRGCDGKAEVDEEGYEMKRQKRTIKTDEEGES